MLIGIAWELKTLPKHLGPNPTDSDVIGLGVQPGQEKPYNSSGGSLFGQGVNF